LFAYLPALGTMCVQKYHVLTLLLKGNSVTEQVNIQVPWFDLLTSNMRNTCLGAQLGVMSPHSILPSVWI